MKKYILELTIFLSGGLVMVFELVGSRILAPYLGASLIVWTSLIGIILGSLSLGYYLGGKISDISQNKYNLIIILFISAVFVTFSVLIKDDLLSYLVSTNLSVQLINVLASIVLFSPASVSFGMVTPYATRLKIEDLKNSGETLGRMYAISTLGSISGTFLAGFYLVPTFGSTNILFFIVLVLLVLIVILATSEKKTKKDFIIFVSLLVLTCINFFTVSNRVKGYTEISTAYNDIRIIDGIDRSTGRPTRSYITNPYGAQSAIFLDKNDDLVFDVYKYYRLSRVFNKEGNKTLMIGGGVFTYARDFLRENKEGSIDIVEIDPGLLDVARDYFNYEDSERVNIIIKDGRKFLNETEEKYDVVIMDAFNSHLSPPFHLTTKEVAEKLSERLNENGIVMINIMSSIEGKNSKFLKAELATYSSVFPKTYVFPVAVKGFSDTPQNIIIIASKNSELPDLESAHEKHQQFIGHLLPIEVDRTTELLTDEYAPVEFFSNKLR